MTPDTFDFTTKELRKLRSMKHPHGIQQFLDDAPYHLADTAWSPRRVLAEQTAHCLEGAIFAAAALRANGYPPLLLDLEADNDTDHVIAIYRDDGCWGAVAKSNFVGLRFREPIYHSLRELVMSYFEQFYNVEREKTLRSYTLPLNLKAFDKWNWMTSDEHLERIADRLDTIRKVPVLTEPMISTLSLVDERSYRAGLLEANERGLYRPASKRRKASGLNSLLKNS